MKPFKGQEIVVTAGISIVVISLAYGLLYLPRSHQINRLQKEIKRFHQEIQAAERMVSRVPNPKKEIAVIKERLRKLKEKATNEEQIPRIMQQLFEKTGELDINVISIKPRGDAEGISVKLPEGVGKVFIEININCSYKTLLDYMTTLKELTLLFTIEDLSIKKAGGESSMLDVFLILSTYVMA